VPAAVPAGDVELKHLLWTLQQQWGMSTGAWLEAPFFELDVVDTTEQVGGACGFQPQISTCCMQLLCAAMIVFVIGHNITYNVSQ
jgi:hypothetical protein